MIVHILMKSYSSPNQKIYIRSPFQRESRSRHGIETIKIFFQSVLQNKLNKNKTLL